MFSETRIRIVLASLGCLLLFLSASHAAGGQPLGRVLYSHAASLGGVPVPGSETIVPGDVLTTSEEGSALIELRSGTRVKVTESSSVRLLLEGQAVRAELLSGTVVSESIGKPAMIVSTPTCEFGPAQESESRYRVQLSEEKTTLAAALEGNVIITTKDRGESYILREGTYASIPPDELGSSDQPTPLDGRAGADRTGTVSQVIPEGTAMRSGQGAELALKADDGVGWQDVVRTSQKGRLQIALADGSSLNVGSGSTFKISREDRDPKQLQLSLISGIMRVRIRLDATLDVQSPTAAIRASGSDLIVEAGVGVTGVFCMQGTASIQNYDAAVDGQVILHTGEFTRVGRRLPPPAPAPASDRLLQSLVDRVAVPPPGAKGQMAAKPRSGWHIGTLSEAESVGLLAGVGTAAAAGIAVPLATAPATSQSRPH